MDQLPLELRANIVSCTIVQAELHQVTVKIFDNRMMSIEVENFESGKSISYNEYIV
jgi:hypothetical protein